MAVLDKHFAWTIWNQTSTTKSFIVHTSYSTESTTDNLQNFTPREFKRGLAPPRASGVMGASRLGRSSDWANPAVLLHDSFARTTPLQIPQIAEWYAHNA